MSYGQERQTPYAQGPASASGYGQLNPYETNSSSNYEMQDFNGSSAPSVSGTGGGGGGAGAGGVAAAAAAAPRPPAALSQSEFLTRVQNLRNEIKSLTGDIDYIGQLHQRTLGTTDSEATRQLEQYVATTQVRNSSIKDGIKGLERDLARTTDPSRNTKSTQLQSLRTFFKSELDKYQSIERDYQQRYRDQIARQYRIVNPDASEEEVRVAAEADWSNEGVFQMALRSNRTGHAASLLGNVRARHNELLRIDQTLAQLAILYQELAALVEQQDPVIVAAEENAQNTVENIEKGNEQVLQATDHARRRRKLKWWLFFIILLIAIAIALGVGLGVSLSNNHKGGNNNNNRNSSSKA